MAAHFLPLSFCCCCFCYVWLYALVLNQIQNRKRQTPTKTNSLNEPKWAIIKAQSIHRTNDFVIFTKYKIQMIFNSWIWPLEINEHQQHWSIWIRNFCFSYYQHRTLFTPKWWVTNDPIGFMLGFVLRCDLRFYSIYKNVDRSIPDQKFIWFFFCKAQYDRQRIGSFTLMAIWSWVETVARDKFNILKTDYTHPHTLITIQQIISCWRKTNFLHTICDSAQSITFWHVL